MGSRSIRRTPAPPPDAPAAFDQAVLTDVAQLARLTNTTDAATLAELATLVRASLRSDSAALSEVATVFDRATSLTVETDEPTADTTGYYPAIPRTSVSGDVTLSTPGQVYENKTVSGRISVTAANVTIRNCLIQGQNLAPTGTYLVQATNAGVSGLVVEDCEIVPQYPHWGWNGIGGHDFTARRLNIHHVTDGVGIAGENVVLEQLYIHDLAWWTAASGGVVHTSDTETHNDCIQHHYGIGAVIRGCRLDAYFARQYGHWWVTNPSVEPYTTIALQSLSAGAPGFGGPYQVIPNRPATNGTTPASGINNEANGRYNVDDLACYMINALGFPTTDITFHGNWCRGGNFGVNGGLSRSAGQNLGTFYRNKFSRDQGNQGSEGNTTHTITLDSTWTGNVDGGVGTSNKNYYLDDGAEILFRTNG